MTACEKYAALLDAYHQGALEVEYADKRVRYRSLDEMERILQKLKEECQGSGAAPANGGRRYGEYYSGL